MTTKTPLLDQLRKAMREGTTYPNTIELSDLFAEIDLLKKLAGNEFNPMPELIIGDGIQWRSEDFPASAVFISESNDTIVVSDCSGFRTEISKDFIRGIYRKGTEIWKTLQRFC